MSFRYIITKPWFQLFAGGVIFVVAKPELAASTFSAALNAFVAKPDLASEASSDRAIKLAVNLIDRDRRIEPAGPANMTIALTIGASGFVFYLWRVNFVQHLCIP